MEKVELHNINGQKLTEINIKHELIRVDGIQWGGKIYIWNHTHEQFREANILPAILNPKK